MIKFLAKGLLRDRARSLFPILVITLGVSIVVLMNAYVTGAIGGMYRSTARFSTGHVKVQTRAAIQEDVHGVAELALVGNQMTLKQLESLAPEMSFHERIYFGALLDAPDDSGETKYQSTAMITAVDLTSKRNEIHTLGLDRSLMDGRLPRAPGEALITQTFQRNIGLKLGDSVTLIGADMDGGMAVGNFTPVGTIRFGVAQLDRNTLIIGLEDGQEFLALPDGATEIFGFYKDDQYTYHRPEALEKQFNQQHSDPKDEFSPQMRYLEQQNNLESVMVIYKDMMVYIDSLFIMIMAIVLWNTGLMSGIRRYSEMGVRLAMGETKRHAYTSLLIESVFVGIAGTLFGTALGLLPAYWMQEVGIDITGMLSGDMSVMLEDRIRAQITAATYFSGILPGVVAPFIGALISGLGIFRRDTSRLFVELEV